MKKNTLNYIVDILMTIAFVITAISGLVIFFFLPSGVKQGSYQTFLGIIKGTWSTIHDRSGILFILLGLIHFILHWNWIVAMTKNLSKKK